jgi:hypothetical protein
VPIAANDEVGQEPSERDDAVVRTADLASHSLPVSCLRKDCVGVASEDSFPASDAPSWTGLVATGTNKLQQFNPSEN